MKIYEYSGFPNPRRVQIFLAEKGVTNIDTVQVNVPEGEHRQPEYLAKNPYGAVPTLELDDGSFISETMAICRYLDGSFEGPSLMGDSPAEKATIEMWERRVAQTLFDTVAFCFHHGTEGLGELELYQNKEWGEKNREFFRSGLEKLNDLLGERDFIAGKNFSVADITAYCAVGYAAYVDEDIPEDCSNLRRWYTNISQRPSMAN